MPNDLRDRIAHCATLLREAADIAGMTVSGDGRVSEADMAKLLGMSAGHLKALRIEGRAPSHHQPGGPGTRISYKIELAAEWIERGFLEV